MIEMYSIEGFYIHKGEKGQLKGEFELNSNGSFETLVEDLKSLIPKQFILGNLGNDNNVSKLEFLKSPPYGNNLANLVYNLEKSKSEDFSGKYVGSWNALPYKVWFDKETGLFTGEIDLSSALFGGYAELKLLKK